MNCALNGVTPNGLINRKDKLTGMNKSNLRLGKKLIMLAISFVLAVLIFAVVSDQTTEQTVCEDSFPQVETSETITSEEIPSTNPFTVTDKFSESSEETEEVYTSEVTEESSVGESIEETSSSIETTASVEEEIPTVVTIETTETTEYDLSEVPLSQSTIDAIVTSCEEYDVPIPIALAVINTESNFIDGLWSEANCYGLMGLHASYFPNIYTPEDNVRSGIEFLGSLLEEYGDPYIALNVYANGHYTGNLTYQAYVMGYAEEWSAKTGCPISI